MSNQVVVHNSDVFRRFCDRLEQNEEGLTKVIVCLYAEVMRDEDFSLLIDRLTNNRTVQILSIGLGLSLRSEQLDALGSVFATNGIIKKLRLLNVHEGGVDMDPLWRRSFQSCNLESVCVNSYTNGQQNVIESFVDRWTNDQQPRINDFHISECLLTKEAADAIVDLMSRKELPRFILRFTQCIYDDVEDRCRIAEALKHSQVVSLFAMDDDLDEKSSKRFGDAVAANLTLGGVLFDHCSNAALPHITKGILNNHKLMSAQVSGSSSHTGDEVAQDCMQQVNHAMKLNAAGRILMHTYAQEGKPLAFLDLAWLYCLIRISEDNADHAVMYSWILEYSDVFVRWALRRSSRKRPAQPELNPRPRKPSRTCS